MDIWSTLFPLGHRDMLSDWARRYLLKYKNDPDVKKYLTNEHDIIDYMIYYGDDKELAKRIHSSVGIGKYHKFIK